MDKEEFFKLISSKRRNLQTKVPDELLRLVNEELHSDDRYSSMTVLIIECLCDYLVERGVLDEGERKMFMENLRTRKSNN